MELKHRHSIPITPLGAVFVAALCFCGGFHEYVSAAVSVALGGVLLKRLIRNKQLRVPLHPVNLGLMAFPLLYLFSSFFAADRGYALLGFVKYLPVTLFVPALTNGKGERDALLDLLPPAAAVQTVLSAILMQIPSLKTCFSVSGRLAGFFQYPNTFALFLLLALLVILTREKLSAADLICLPVLVFGVLYSGSRTTAVLTAVFVLVSVFTGSGKKKKIAAVVCVAGLAAAAGIYAITSGNYASLGRFLRISLTESTLVGRLLYWKDGLRLVFAHPFGLGYMGWGFLQYANQTGVYTVQFVHNDYLQILLDVGVLGGIAAAAGLVFGVFSKKTDRRRRLMLLALCAHMVMDFDLEFLCVFLLLAALLYVEDGKTFVLSKRGAAGTCLAALGCVSLLPGLSQGLYHFKQYEAALKVYPLNTFAEIACMQRVSGSTAGKLHAEAIVRRNPASSEAWGELALAAFQANDAEEMARCKLLQIENRPYDISLYDEYCYMLSVCCGAGKASGDLRITAFCREKALEVPAMLERLRERTDTLAYQIDDQPDFTLNDASTAFIENMRKGEDL